MFTILDIRIGIRRPVIFIIDGGLDDNENHFQVNRYLNLKSKRITYQFLSPKVLLENVLLDKVG